MSKSTIIFIFAILFLAVVNSFFYLDRQQASEKYTRWKDSTDQLLFIYQKQIAHFDSTNADDAQLCREVAMQLDSLILGEGFDECRNRMKHELTLHNYKRQMAATIEKCQSEKRVIDIIDSLSVVMVGNKH